jgi:choline dehydrogenase-like flavoprotein
MLTDGRDLAADTHFKVDLCIVGSGPAGISLIKEFRRSHLKVLLIERGDASADTPSRIPIELEFRSPHFRYPATVLRSQFGGMAATWRPLVPDWPRSARFLPMDPIDFTTRYCVPHSGWPITFDELKPYYDRAQLLCGLEPFNYHEPEDIPGAPPLSGPSEDFLTCLEQFGPSSVFTSEPLQEIKASRDVHLIVNANPDHSRGRLS